MGKIDHHKVYSMGLSIPLLLLWSQGSDYQRLSQYSTFSCAVMLLKLYAYWLFSSQLCYAKISYLRMWYYNSDKLCSKKFMLTLFLMSFEVINLYWSTSVVMTASIVICLVSTETLQC